MNGNGGLSVLIIEWDGDRPPTRWYNRLHKLGLTTRGDKEISPLARREGRSGVISQEGALVLNTDSEARALGHLAEELGAKAVTIARMEVEELGMTQQDQLVMNRIQSTLGRRGRPETPKNWLVTCLDEMRSYEEWGRWPVNCKHCGSFHIATHEGNQVTGALSGKTLLDQWRGSRFTTGSFEEPIIDPAGIELTADKIELVPEYRDVVKKLENSTLAYEVNAALALGAISQEKAFRYLDYGIASLRLDPTVRVHNRLHGIEKHFMAGGNEDGINIKGKADDVDRFDIQFFGDHSSIRALDPVHNF